METLDQTISEVNDVNEHDVHRLTPTPTPTRLLRAANGTEVQITVSVSDADGSNNGIAYENASPQAFHSDTTGVVTAADINARL